MDVVHKLNISDIYEAYNFLEEHKNDTHLIDFLKIRRNNLTTESNEDRWLYFTTFFFTYFPYISINKVIRGLIYWIENAKEVG